MHEIVAAFLPGDGVAWPQFAGFGVRPAPAGFELHAVIVALPGRRPDSFIRQSPSRPTIRGDPVESSPTSGAPQPRLQPHRLPGRMLAGIKVPVRIWKVDLEGDRHAGRYLLRPPGGRELLSAEPAAECIAVAEAVIGSQRAG